MYISRLSLAAAAVVSTAQAVYFTNTNFEGIRPGKGFEITWADAVGPVQVILVNGDPQDLQTVYPIVFYGTDGKAIWGPSGALCAGQYAMKIIDDLEEFNFSPMFTLSEGFDTRPACQPRMKFSTGMTLPPSSTATADASTAAPSASGTSSVSALTSEDVSTESESGVVIPTVSVDGSSSYTTHDTIPFCTTSVITQSACFKTNTAIAVGPTPSTIVMNFTLSSLHKGSSTSGIVERPTSTSIDVTPEEGTAIEIRSSLAAVVLAFIAAFGMH